MCNHLTRPVIAETWRIDAADDRCRPAVFWSELAAMFKQLVSRLARRATHFYFALDDERDSGSHNTTGVISMRVGAIAACVTLGFASASSAKPLDTLAGSFPRRFASGCNRSARCSTLRCFEGLAADAELSRRVVPKENR
jgi:hypothetical protein